MKKEMYEKIIKLCLNQGCDFAEVYYEVKKGKSYILVDNKIDDITSSNSIGVGIRVSKNENVYYASTNDLSEENMIQTTKKLLATVPKENSSRKIKFQLGTLEEIEIPVKISHNSFPIKKKLSILKEINRIIRKESSLITQVRVGLNESDKEFVIANSEGRFIQSSEILTRVFAVAISTKEEKKEQSVRTHGGTIGYELFDSFNIEDFSKKTASVAVKKLSAKNFSGGKFPVVLAPGFGAVIFHEACGHGLEATSVSENLSVFSDKLGQKIASDKVTLIDDGTLLGEFGTTKIDSEGNKTQKNILIEKGILKSFLVDNLNSKKMNLPSTGSGRRQSYIYPPTSRMNNTYLAPGTDKVEDIIKSVEYGIYCKNMSGGSVEIKTGNFNFVANENYIIRNGKLAEMITDITLIGKGQDILKNVEMISDDLLLQSGYCGSESGTVAVTIGQPTIKISEILVGGKSE